jgi:hypothetical protein
VLGHSVVDVHERVEIGLAGGVQARPEIPIPEERRREAHEVPPGEKGADEEDSRGERRPERGLDREEPRPVVPEEVRGEREERQVNEGEIEEEPAAERRCGSQTAIPYFSNRR